jgi:hypothetical protein
VTAKRQKVPLLAEHRDGSTGTYSTPPSKGRAQAERFVDGARFVRSPREAASKAKVLAGADGVVATVRLLRVSSATPATEENSFGQACPTRRDDL